MIYLIMAALTLNQINMNKNETIVWASVYAACIASNKLYHNAEQEAKKALTAYKNEISIQNKLKQEMRTGYFDHKPEE